MLTEFTVMSTKLYAVFSWTYLLQKFKNKRRTPKFFTDQGQGAPPPFPNFGQKLKDHPRERKIPPIIEKTPLSSLKDPSNNEKRLIRPEEGPLP